MTYNTVAGIAPRKIIINKKLDLEYSTYIIIIIGNLPAIPAIEIGGVF